MTTYDEQLLSAVQGELTIIIRPYCEYCGNRAQIEAEGVIPDGTEWPDGFCDSYWWDANGVQYWLRRKRPEGVKGPRRNFLACDNWRLRISPGGLWQDDRINQKAKELEQLLYRQSAAGRAEWARNWDLYSAAIDDKKFQAFKSLIPALIPPPRKRRSTTDAG